VFNELGKVWGFLIGSYNDIPPKVSNEVHVPDPLQMPGGDKMADVPMTTRDLKKKRKKDRKKEKRRK